MTANILLIEDDREIASSILTVLDAAGYKTRHAPNGIEGRREVEAERPDMVITDMMMPRMGGFPILEFLSTVDPPPKVIMITANEGGRHKAFAELATSEKVAVDDYIRKPFAMDVLLEAIERILGETPEPKKKKVDKEKGTAADRMRKARKKST